MKSNSIYLLHLIDLFTPLFNQFLMKNFVTLALLTAIMVSFFSCKKDSNSSSITPSLSMKFEGTGWTATTVLATYTSYNSSTTITASKTGDQLVLIYTGTGKGTYNFTDDEAFGSGNIGPVSFSTLVSFFPTGSVIVTSYDSSKKLISGTFSFTGDNMGGSAFQVTEGKFENVTVTMK